MNLGQFRVAVNRKTGVAVDQSALNEFVNEAVQAVGEERDWPWKDGLQTVTTDGSAAYALPADWGRTRTVTVNGYPTRRVNVADGDSYDLGGYVRASEYGYVIESDELVVYPTPPSGQTILHRYVKTEPTLSSDADEPLVESRFHQAVVCYAAALVCERHGDVAKADRHRAEYERWLRRMRDAMSRSQQPSRIRVRPGAGW